MKTNSIKQNKFLIFSIIIIVLLVGLLFILKQNKHEATRLDEIADMYDKLIANSDDTKKYTDFLPDLSYVDIYLVAAEHKKTLASNQPTSPLNQQLYAQLDSGINKLNIEFNNLGIKYSELQNDHKLNAYSDLLANSNSSDINVEKFLKYVNTDANSFYRVIRLNISKEQLIDLQGSLDTSSIYLFSHEILTDKNWPDISNLNIFQINETKIGVVYLINDSYGYKNAAVFDMYEVKDNKIQKPLKRITDFSKISDSNSELQLRSMIDEIIRNER